MSHRVRRSGHLGARRGLSAPPSAARLRVPGVAFLLAQLGFHSSSLWKDRLAPLGMDPRHVVLLRHVAAAEGQSQQALGKAMQIPASRMVALVDELERRGVLERRPSLADRRAHALVLTGEGRRLLDRIMKVSADHEAQDLTAAGVFPPLARAAPQPGRGAHRRVAMAARGWTAPRAARPSAGTGQQVDSDRPGG